MTAPRITHIPHPSPKPPQSTIETLANPQNGHNPAHAAQ
jgi:hypothetical protein